MFIYKEGGGMKKLVVLCVMLCGIASVLAVEVTNDLPEQVRLSCFCIKRNGIDPEFVPNARVSEIVATGEKIVCNADDVQTYLIVVNHLNVKEQAPLVFRFPDGHYKLRQNKMGLIVPEVHK
jgi:hypothetical protein